MFEIGQQVVCVDADGATDIHGKWSGRSQITKGDVYTVRWAGNYDHSDKGTYFGIRLVEIRRPVLDTPYNARRFRPIHKTDISIFTAMLEPRPAKEREDA